jgi:hypothetical protein
VWFKFDLSGTPPHLKDPVKRKDWTEIKRLVAEDVRECGGLLDEFWIENPNSKDNRAGNALVHIQEDRVREVTRCLKQKWRIARGGGSSSVLNTIEDL